MARVHRTQAAMFCLQEYKAGLAASWWIGYGSQCECCAIKTIIFAHTDRTKAGGRFWRFIENKRILDTNTDRFKVQYCCATLCSGTGLSSAEGGGVTWGLVLLTFNWANTEWRLISWSASLGPQSRTSRQQPAGQVTDSQLNMPHLTSDMPGWRHTLARWGHNADGMMQILKIG